MKEAIIISIESYRDYKNYLKSINSIYGTKEKLFYSQEMLTNRTEQERKDHNERVLRQYRIK